MRLARFLGLALVLLMLAMPATAQNTLFEGSLADECLDGTNEWASGVSIAWNIVQNDGSFTYNYTLTSPRGGFSHAIIGTTPDVFTSANIWDVILNGAASDNFEIRTFSPNDPGNSNPNLPGDIYGVKFELSGTTATISFTSDRVPTWRDFYAKDGTAGGTTGPPEEEDFNSVWNTTFGDPSTMECKIAAPDTVVPEPSSIMALLAGLGGFGGMFLRRRK